MIAGTAPCAGEAPGDAFDELVLIDGKLNDIIEMPTAFREKDLERFRLMLGPWESVEDRAFVRRGVEPLADQGADDRVADQLATRHHFLGLQADGRPGGDGFTEHVARRQLDHAAVRLKARGLRALAGPRWAEKNDIHHAQRFSPSKTRAN
jgi:hypothetical protein